MKALAIGFSLALLVVAPLARADDGAVLLGKDGNGYRHYLYPDSVRVADGGRVVIAALEVREPKGASRKVVAAFDCRDNAFLVLQTERYDAKGRHLGGSGPGASGVVLPGTVVDTWHAGACAVGQALREASTRPRVY